MNKQDKQSEYAVITKELAARQMLLSDLLIDFIEDQDVKESSRRTYARQLKQFFQFVELRDLDMNMLTRADIIDFKEYLFNDGLTALTVGGYLTVVRKFFEWTESKKIYPNIAKGIKTPRRSRAGGFKKKAASPEIARRLMAHFEGEAYQGRRLLDTLSSDDIPIKRQGLRDRAIVSLMLRCGLRSIEVSRANVEDITITENGRRVLWVHGKGRDEKDELVCITTETYKPIKEYLESRGKVKGSDPLFASACNRNHGGRLSTRCISCVVKEGFRAIGIDDPAFTCHSLRHTCACFILQGGGLINDVQDVLRHSSIDTSRIYLETIKKQKRLENPAENFINNIL